jgi:hypothetical protein
MRHAIRLQLLLVAVCWGAAPLTHAYEPDWCRGYPGWYASGDALFMHRSGPRSSPLILADRGTIDDLGDDTVLFDSEQLTFSNYTSGFRTEIGRSLGNGLAIEGSYFLLHEWDHESRITTNGFITPPPIDPLNPFGDGEGLSPPLPFALTFYPADTFYEAVEQRVSYESELQGAEINVKATWNHCQFIRSEYVGFRYLNLAERFQVASQDEVFSTPDNGIGFYNVHTDNDLFGLQLGEDVGLPLFGCLLLNAKMKAGLFVNAAEQTTTIIDSNILRYNAREVEEELSFVGELNVSANFKVNRMLSIRGGYNFLWITGVALAAEQGYPVALAGFSPLNDNGRLFLHGFSIGLEIAR